MSVTCAGRASYTELSSSTATDCSPPPPHSPHHHERVWSPAARSESPDWRTRCPPQHRCGRAGRSQWPETHTTLSDPRTHSHCSFRKELGLAIEDVARVVWKDAKFSNKTLLFKPWPQTFYWTFIESCSRIWRKCILCDNYHYWFSLIDTGSGHHWELIVTDPVHAAVSQRRNGSSLTAPFRWTDEILRQNPVALHRLEPWNTHTLLNTAHSFLTFWRLRVIFQFLLSYIKSSCNHQSIMQSQKRHQKKKKAPKLKIWFAPLRVCFLCW